MDEENKTTEEEYKAAKVSVRSMSKKVVIWLVVILIVLSIYDIVKSTQNGTSTWIQRYLQTNYPNLSEVFAGSSSSSSSSDVATAAIEEEYEEEEEEEEEETPGPFDEDGFIFPYSSEAYLDEDSIYTLNKYEDYKFKALLGFARNEIYARHGFKFKDGGKYDEFYSQYDWYNEMKHRDMEDSDLNEYEIENIRLIVQVEEQEGFR